MISLTKNRFDLVALQETCRTKITVCISSGSSHKTEHSQPIHLYFANLKKRHLLFHVETVSFVL